MGQGVDVKLVLEDGTALQGRALGAVLPVAGEVVFHTGMTGYVESLTDPSFRGQLLVLTTPLPGGYGVPAAREPDSLDGPFESARIQVQGLIVQHAVDQPSHHASARSLDAWLAAEGVPGVTGVDTRTLTRHLREHGTLRGWLFPACLSLEEARAQARGVDMKQVARLAAAPAVHRLPGGERAILVVDAGAKDGVVRALRQRDCTVIRAPWFSDLLPLAAQAHGVVVANGPGDPKDVQPLVEQVRTLLRRADRPVLGICLGHQVLALAAGADTTKLPYGHRSANQPVQDLRTGRCFLTSQNHGYAVRTESLPPDWEPWFINLNDGTNEGIRSRRHPFLGVQFHPEAQPGPADTAFLFDEFLALVDATRR